MALELADLLGGRCIPYPNSVIGRPRCNAAAIWREGYRINQTAIALSLRISLPDFVSHILTVLSRNPDAMRLPSGEKATDLTKYCGVG